MNKTIAFCVEHFAALSLFLLMSYILGGILIERTMPGETDKCDDRIFLYTSTGVGLLIVFIFFVSLAGLLNPYAVSSLFVLVFISYIFQKDLKFFNFKKNKINVLAYLLTFSLLVPLLLTALYPPIEWDEISYHLPYARYYVQNNGLGVNPYLRYPLCSHNFDLLYSLSLLFYDDALAHLVHASAAILTALGIYYIGEKTLDKITGLLAALIFLSSDLVLHLMKTAYIDLGLTLFVFLTFYLIIKSSLANNDRWLYLAGFACGIFLGIKYSGFLFFSLLLLWVVLDTRKLSSILKFLVPAIIIGSPWYIRNYMISGDPISPFGGKVFGYWLWSKEDVLHQGKELIGHGVPRNFVSFLKLPVFLYKNPGPFMEGRFSAGMLAVFPGFLLFRRFPPLYRKIFIFVFANVIIWFFGVQVLRYLLPIFPVISLMAAAVIMTVWDLIVLKPIELFNNRKGKLPSIFISSKDLPFTKKDAAFQLTLYKAAAFLPLIMAFIAFISMDKLIIKDIKHHPIPVTGKMRDDYISSNIPVYPLLQIANQTSFPIYQMGFENTFYYADGKMMGDHFGPMKYSNFINDLMNPEKLHERLKAANVKLFLVDRNRLWRSNTGKPVQFTGGPQFAPFFLVLKKTPNAILYFVK